MNSLKEKNNCSSPRGDLDNSLSYLGQGPFLIYKFGENPAHCCWDTPSLTVWGFLHQIHLHSYERTIPHINQIWEANFVRVGLLISVFQISWLWDKIWRRGRGKTAFIKIQIALTSCLRNHKFLTLVELCTFKGIKTEESWFDVDQF